MAKYFGGFEKPLCKFSFNLHKYARVFRNSTQWAKARKKIPISNMCLGSCMITSKIKINVFLKFFLHSCLLVVAPFGELPLKKIPKTLILAFDASSALSWQNEYFFRVLAHCAQVYRIGYPKSSLIVGKKSLDEQLKYHRCPTCAEVFPYKSFLSIHLAKGHKRYSKYSKRSI